MLAPEQEFSSVELEETAIQSTEKNREAIKTPEEIMNYMRGALVFDSLKWVPRRWRAELLEEFIKESSEEEKQLIAIESFWGEQAIGVGAPSGEVGYLLSNLNRSELIELVSGAISNIDWLPTDKRAEIIKRTVEEYEDTEAGREILHEWIAEPLANLTILAKQDTLEYLKAIRGVGAFNQLQRLVDAYAHKHRELFEDKRFEFQRNDQREYLMNDIFGKLKTVEWLRDSFKEGQANPNELKKIARFSFDANGLKAVNDLSGSHEKGDEYLKRVAEVFCREASRSPARRKLEELGAIEVIPLLGGGDEYSLLIKSEQELSSQDLELVVDLYQEEIAVLDVADLIDFDDQQVLLRYAGISQAEFALLSVAQQGEKIRQIKQEIPDGFKMWASVSGGAATLYEGINRAVVDKRESKRLTGQEVCADRMFEKAMGGLWDESDERANQAKENYKHRLETGDDVERFYFKVLKRTEEARWLRARIDKLWQEMVVTEASLSELRTLVGSEDDGAAGLEFFQQLAAQIERLDSKRDQVREMLGIGQTGTASIEAKTEQVFEARAERTEDERLISLLVGRVKRQAQHELNAANPELQKRLAHLPEARRQEVSERLQPVLARIDAQIQEKQQHLVEQESAADTTPQHLRRLRAELQKLKKERDRFIDRELEMFNLSYADQRFEFIAEDGGSERLMKDVYGKAKVADWLEAMFKTDRVGSVELNCIGRLFFDANGLKAVNDLSGSHTKGDEYLKRIAQVFRSSDSNAVLFLKTLGQQVELVPVLGSGDEFALLIKSDRELEQVDLDHAVKLFQDEIEGLDVTDLVDFQQEDVRQKFAEGLIPKDFKMRASASGGAALLGSGLSHARIDHCPNKRLTGQEKDIREMYFKIIGGLWDEADARAVDQKMKYKKQLASSDEENDRFYSQVLKRTEEARQMEQEINDLSEVLTRVDRQLNELRLLVRDTIKLANVSTFEKTLRAQAGLIIERVQQELSGAKDI
jgi:GGDEF domain-containing protein